MTSRSEYRFMASRLDRSSYGRHIEKPIIIQIDGETHACPTIHNILWVVLVGCWMALGYLGAGVLNCITIIGIPFGIQSFKMAKLALWPFGAQIYSL